MEKPFVIDADGHIMEHHPEAVDWEAALPEKFKHRAPKRIPFQTGGGRLFFEGQIWPMPIPGSERWLKPDDYAVHAQRPGMWQPALRLPDMDRDGIDVAVVFGGVMALACSGIKDAELAAAMARAYNDWAAAYCAYNPARLKFVGAMPSQDPARAVAEMRRAVRDLGAVAMELPTNIGGMDLDAPHWDPIWAAAQDLDIALCVHSGFTMPGLDVVGEKRLDSQFYLNLCAFPFELMLALTKTIASGVFDRYPRLRLAFMEGNCAWLPFWLDRMDANWEMLREQLAAKQRPSDYWRAGHFWISCSYEESSLPHVVAQIGADNIVYASDYYHFDAKFPGTVQDILNMDLTDEAKRKILGENASQLYRIPIPARV